MLPDANELDATVEELLSSGCLVLKLANLSHA